MVDFAIAYGWWVFKPVVMEYLLSRSLQVTSRLCAEGEGQRHTKEAGAGSDYSPQPSGPNEHAEKAWDS